MTNVQRDGYLVSTDPERIQIDVVHAFLTTSYWAAGIQREQVARSIQHSICFGLYEVASGTQVGFARVITDRTTFGYLADVFVLETHRGRGLGQWLMEVIRDNPEFRTFRRWMLVTRDAHPLYRKVGFSPLTHPDRVMERMAASPTTAR